MQDASAGRRAPVRAAAVVTAMFLAGLYVGALVVRGQAPNSEPTPASVRCTDADQHLGRVWLTDDLALTFHLINDEPAETFHVGPLRGGCACTAVEPELLTLEPGEEAAVTARVDLQRREWSGDPPWAFEEVIIGIAKSESGGKVPVRMTAKMVVDPSYRIEPQALSFGSAVGGQEHVRVADVECLSSEPAVGLEVLSAPDPIAVEVQEAAGAGGRYALEAALAADAPYGPLRGRIRFRGKLESGPFVTASIGVNGVVVHDLHALPSAVLFGAVPVGQERALVVSLQSRKGAPFTVEGASPAAEEIAVKCLGPRPGGTQAYEVAFTGKEVGPFESEVAFALKTASRPDHGLVVPVKAYVVREDVW